MKRRHHRPDIVRLLARRARRGLTFRELSEESGIPIPTLSYWASKLRLEEASRAEFVPVEIEEEEEEVGMISIETASGLRLRVEPGFDEAHLARVLSVLGSRC
jgi:transcriptional regulator with XRE-family HTH domain